MLGTKQKQTWISRAATVAALAGLCVLGLPSTASADEWNMKTKVTFSAPVEVPGMTLPAGSYVFKVMDNSDRNVVQIFDKDERKLMTSFMAVPEEREAPPNQTIVRFEERSGNSPEAVHLWFYPGDKTGHLFLYRDKGHKDKDTGF